MYILVINCGSTSTKMAIFNDETCVCENVRRYETCEIPQSMEEDLSLRAAAIEDFAEKSGVGLTSLDCIACRGGTFYPVRGGAYVLDENLVEALTETAKGNADNLSGIIGYSFAQKLQIPAYIYDAVTVDDLKAVARPSGIKGYDRYSRTHTLNTRAMARAAAAKAGGDFSQMNIITAHAGGGVSVNVFEHGVLSDLVTGEEGGFSAERCGGLQGDTVLEILEKEGPEALEAYYHGKGGLVSYFGTNSALDVEEKIAAGDDEAAVVFEAMAYQIAKSIGSMAVAVSGKVDLIVLTGGIMRSEKLQQWIKERVSFIAPVEVMAGEAELAALAGGALRAHAGKEPARHFVKEK